MKNIKGIQVLTKEKQLQIFGGERCGADLREACYASCGNNPYIMNQYCICTCYIEVPD